MENLLVLTTFFKGAALKISINPSVIQEEKAVLKVIKRSYITYFKRKTS